MGLADDRLERAGAYAAAETDPMVQERELFAEAARNVLGVMHLSETDCDLPDLVRRAVDHRLTTYRSWRGIDPQHARNCVTHLVQNTEGKTP